MINRELLLKGIVIATLSVLFFTVIPTQINAYFEGYDTVKLQFSLYITALLLGAILLREPKERATCVWFVIMHIVAVIYETVMANAAGFWEKSSVTLLTTSIWALVLFFRHQINRKLFFLIGFFKVFRTKSTEFIEFGLPSEFERFMDYYISFSLLYKFLMALFLVGTSGLFWRFGKWEPDSDLSSSRLAQFTAL